MDNASKERRYASIKTREERSKCEIYFSIRSQKGESRREI